MNKLKISITIEKELYDQVKELSEKEERNFSQQLSKMLKDHLKSKG